MNTPVITPKVSKEVTSLSKQLVNDTYDSSINSINMGFTLAAALAWNESIKAFIREKVPKMGSQYHIMYALAVTLLSAIVFTLTRRLLKPSLTRKDVTPLITMS